MSYRPGASRVMVFLGCGLAFAAVPWSACAAPAPPKARVSAGQADRAALQRFHGRVIGKTALENEDGKWEYSVMVRSGKTLREVMVSARTGKIASVEVTTPAKEQIEANADAVKAKKQRIVHKRGK